MVKTQILWVSRLLGKAGSAVKPHKHDYYHMLHVLQGELDVVVEDAPLLLKEGACLLIPKGMEHSYTIVGKDTTEYLEVKFALPDKRLDERFERLGLCHSDSPAAIIMIQQIAEEYAALGPLADEAATSYLFSLLYVLDRQRRHQQKREFRYIDASAYSDLSQQIIHYLEDHFSEPFSLDRLAQDLQYGKSSLCSTLKKDTGTTIVDCLNMIRIRRAAELIAYSDVSLSQVSQLCGFASPNNFNRVFLKYVGVTPGQCRRSVPASILQFKKLEDQHPNSFIYSVLARKRISFEPRPDKQKGS